MSKPLGAHVLNTRRFNCLENRKRFLAARRERFFTKNVFAVLGSRDRGLSVQLIRAGVYEKINI